MTIFSLKSARINEYQKRGERDCPAHFEPIYVTKCAFFGGLLLWKSCNDQKPFVGSIPFLSATRNLESSIGSGLHYTLWLLMRWNWVDETVGITGVAGSMPTRFGWFCRDWQNRLKPASFVFNGGGLRWWGKEQIREDILGVFCKAAPSRRVVSIWGKNSYNEH